jgi:hypothetical protein
VPEFGEPAQIVFNFPVPADRMPPPGRVAVGRVAAEQVDAEQVDAEQVAAERVADRGTDAPTGPGGRLTRRTALAGLAATGAALAVAACTPKQTTPAAELIASDALGPAYTETSQLIAQYDRALASAPALVELLGPLREEHRQHLIALASLIGLAMPAVSAGPHPSGIPLPPPHPTASGSAPGTTTPTTMPTTASPASSAGTPPSVAAGSSTPPEGSAPPTGLTPSSSPTTSVLPSGSASTGLGTAAITAQLSAAEKTAQANAVAACISVAADRVPIVAAIAACRATHVAALR